MPHTEGDAMSSITHVGKIGPADHAHVPSQIGGATTTFTHGGEMRPADLAYVPTQIGDATSVVRPASVLRLVDFAISEILLEITEMPLRVNKSLLNAEKAFPSPDFARKRVKNARKGSKSSWEPRKGLVTRQKLQMISTLKDME